MKHDTYFFAENFRALNRETLYIRDCIVYDYPRGLSLHYFGYIVVPSQTTLYRKMLRNAQGDY